jgi:hypothetical protein
MWNLAIDAKLWLASVRWFAPCPLLFTLRSAALRRAPPRLAAHHRAPQFARAAEPPQAELMVEAAWKSHEWDAVRRHLELPSMVAQQEGGSPRHKLFEVACGGGRRERGAARTTDLPRLFHRPVFTMKARALFLRAFVKDEILHGYTPNRTTTCGGNPHAGD